VLANKRTQTNVTAQVGRKLKTAWRNGTIPVASSRLEFMQRPAAMVFNPRRQSDDHLGNPGC
jgi:hypothetical protein